jgi:hypothetical protein
MLKGRNQVGTIKARETALHREAMWQRNIMREGARPHIM